MPKPHQTLRQLLKLARKPRAPADVLADYSRLRQVFIVEQCARHFGLRADDPAPLFGKSLLDVGCGPGSIAEFLALSGASLTALDADAKALAAAQAHAQAFGIDNIRFLHTRVEDLLPTLQRYDVIVAMDMLEHVPNPGQLLWVLRQLLAPGGLLVVSAITRGPRAWVYHALMPQLVRPWRPLAGGLRGWVRPVELQALMRQVGLLPGVWQGLRFSLLKQRWKKAKTAQTRYLMTAMPMA